MLKFHLQTELHKPVDEVVRLYKNRELMPKWQPGLLSDEAVEDKRGKKVHRLTFRIGSRNMVMTETLLRSTGPHHDVAYDMRGVWNSVHNTFTPLSGGRTLWKSDIAFRFKGITKLIAPFMRSGLEKQSEIIMKNFKSFVEAQ